ncbi:hypothetical protein VNO77_01819 [Canavalia gladiata]|uniref:Uncharacterized protein n=1 Tax=Canavalia gladiata TaxID=3824 RepID=A0AAN9R6N4_CANGL
MYQGKGETSALNLECAMAAVAISIRIEKLTGRLFFLWLNLFWLVMRRGEEENEPWIWLFSKILLLHRMLLFLKMVTFQAICFDFPAACV